MLKHYALIFLLCLIFSCNRENDESLVILTEETEEPQITTNGSLFGLILDENLNPIEDARIITEERTYLSDENGNFEISNQKFNQKGLLIEAVKEGYFANKKLIYSTGNTMDNITMILVDKNPIIPGDENSFTLADGTNLNLAGNAYLDEFGNSYSGEVKIYARWVTANDQHYHEMFPSNFLAFDHDGNEVGVLANGMLLLEVVSVNGALLELDSGTKISVSIPYAGTVLETNSDLKAWIWELEEGRWQEDVNYNISEGKINLVLDKIKDLCFGSAFEQVHIKGQLINTNSGHSINASSIKVTISNADGIVVSHDKTDNQGNFAALVPLNEDLNLNVFNNCNELLRVFPISSLSGNKNVGEFQLEIGEAYTTIVGSLFNCYGFSVRNAVIHIQGAQQTDVLRLLETEDFEFNLFSCFENEFAITITDLDQDISRTFNYGADEDYIVLEDLIFCDQDVTNYLSFLIDGDLFNFNNAEVLRDEVNDELIVQIPTASDPTNYQFLMRLPLDQGAHPSAEYIEILAFDNTQNIDSQEDAKFYSAVCLDQEVKCHTALNISQKEGNNIQGNLIGNLDLEVLNQDNSTDLRSINISCTFSLIY